MTTRLARLWQRLFAADPTPATRPARAPTGTTAAPRPAGFPLSPGAAPAPGPPPASPGIARPRRPVPRPPGEAPWPAEIAGLAARIAPGALASAVARAGRLGIGADEVLLARGLVTPDQLLAATAAYLGLPAARPDEEAAPGQSPTTMERPLAGLTYRGLRGLLASGVLARGRTVVVAPRGLAVRRLARQLAAAPALRGRLRLTSPERLRAHVLAERGAHLANCAAFRLKVARPEASAGTLGASRLLLAGLAVAAAVAPFLAGLMPDAAVLATALPVAALLLGWSILRITACATAGPAPERPPLTEAELPRYSLIVPLHHEAAVLPRLAAHLGRLDYPPEKLQILLVVEPDDPATRHAAERATDDRRFEVVVAPALGPRTKPKAMNAALIRATGDLVAVYDAEDEPEPDQLRRAAAAFAAPGGGRLGCVQARLVIDNAADSWISRQFAAEYAGHFDLMLPLLAGLGLPIPLGGTSNHFRRDALEGAGAWDPFNVTEDADLGIRLARHGWGIAIIGSSTHEEATNTFPAWLRQRTRWYKGWLQTALVHLRRPRALWRDLGPRGAAGIGLLLAGNLFAALIHPFFLAALLHDLAAARVAVTLPGVAAQALGIGVLAAGYGATALYTLVAMRERGLRGCLPTLARVPLYWLMLSLAAWRAMAQLVLDPYRWEKTTHGLARTSRRAGGAADSEVAPQLGGALLRRALEIERRDEAAVLAHEIDHRRVVHRVVAALRRHLAGIDAVGLDRRRHLLGAAGQAENGRVEASDIALHHRRRVPLRVDRDEQRRQLARIRPQFVEHLREVGQRGGADVRAVGEAEEHQEGRAREGLVGHRPAVLVDQLERPAHGGRPGNPGRAAGQQRHGRGEQRRGAEDEKGEDEDDAALGHGAHGNRGGPDRAGPARQKQ